MPKMIHINGKNIPHIEGTKLIALLRPLSAWEMQRLSAYVKSPYFNKHKGVIQLMEFIHAAAPEFAPEQLDKQLIWEHIFGSKPFHIQTLRDLMTYLTRLVKGYLAQDQFKDDSFQQQRYLVQAFRTRGMDTFHRRHLEAGSRKKPSIIRPDDHFERYLWERERVFHLSDNKTRKADNSFERMVGHLDTHYLMMKLRYGCEMLNRNRIQDQHFDIDLLELILGFISSRLSEWEDQPLIEAYFRVCRMLQQEEQTERFQQAYDWIRTRQDHIPSDLLRDLCAYLLNYCIRRINTGNTYFQQELFEQYEWQLESEIILEAGWLSPWDYKNIVSLALKMDRFEWAASFIETYRSHLKPAFRENAHRYNLATLSYAQADYGKALSLLQDVEFDDIFYQIGSRTILLKTYYETAAFEALFYLADATEAYLRRQRAIPRYQAEIHLNFVKYIRKLSHLHIRSRSTYRLVGPKQIETLNRRIRQTKKVAQLNWLEQKISELANQEADS